MCMLVDVEKLPFGTSPLHLPRSSTIQSTVLKAVFLKSSNPQSDGFCGDGRALIQPKSFHYIVQVLRVTAFPGSGGCSKRVPQIEEFLKVTGFAVTDALLSNQSPFITQYKSLE
jgi:hypothetical protein